MPLNATSFSYRLAARCSAAAMRWRADRESGESLSRTTGWFAAAGMDANAVAGELRHAGPAVRSAKAGTSPARCGAADRVRRRRRIGARPDPRVEHERTDERTGAVSGVVQGTWRACGRAGSRAPVEPLLRTPCDGGVRPVKMGVWAGSVRGACACALVKRTPRAASRSIAGVQRPAGGMALPRAISRAACRW